MKDFTKPRPELDFRIDDDVFFPYPALPARVLVEFAMTFDGIDKDTSADKQMEAMLSILERALTPDSYARFSSRINSREKPIDLDQVNEVMEWMLGEYGLRPTQPSELSSNGSVNQDSGMSSTGNTPVVVSTS
jgi:serine protease inhibitor